MTTSTHTRNPRRELRELCNAVFNDRISLLSRIPFFKTRFKHGENALTLQDAFRESWKLASEISDVHGVPHSLVLPFQDVAKPNEIIQAIKKMTPSVDAFHLILHGSYADNTYTKISDVDDIVFLKKKVFSNFGVFKRCYRKLKKINQFYQYIDPLQHHGHWLFTEYDLELFPIHIIPVNRLSSYVSITNHEPIQIRFSENENRKAELARILSYQAEDIDSLFTRLFNHNINMFEMKKLISCISLTVPLVFQLCGLTLTKSEAIVRAEELFDRQNLAILAWASEAREKCNPRMYKKYKSIYRLLCPFFDRSLLQFISETFSPKLTTTELDRFCGIKEDAVRNFLNFLRMKIDETDENKE